MNKRVYVYWVEGKRGHKIALSYMPHGEAWFLHKKDSIILSRRTLKSVGLIHIENGDSIIGPIVTDPIADFIPALAGDDKKST